MCTIEKLTIEEIALKLRLDFEYESDDCELTEVDVYFAAMDEGYTHCSGCEHFVSYDDYSGNHSLCDDCRESLGIPQGEAYYCGTTNQYIEYGN